MIAEKTRLAAVIISICPERGWRGPSDGLAKRKWLSLLPLLMLCMCLMITDEIQCQWAAAGKSQQGWEWKPSGSPSHSLWVPPSPFYYMKCPNWLRHFSSCKTCTHAQQIYLKLFYNQQLNRRKLREKNQGCSFMHKTQPLQLTESILITCQSGLSGLVVFRQQKSANPDRQRWLMSV